MLKRRVDDRMMSIRIGKLMSPMQINSITIEERGKLENRDKCVSPCHIHSNDLPGRKEGPYSRALGVVARPRARHGQIDRSTHRQ